MDQPPQRDAAEYEHDAVDQRQTLDGHAEFRKWTNPDTVDMAQKALKHWATWGGALYWNGQEFPDNEDLQWIQRRVWGKLGY